MIYGSSPQARTLAYDKVGNLLSVSESAAPGRNVVYTYDALNRVTSEASAGVTHGYRYDLSGNRTQVLLGNSDTVLISGYDSRNRLVYLDEGGRITTYGYDARDAMVTRTLPSGQLDVHYYDALGRKEHTTGFADESQNPGATQYQFTYRYDRSGNLAISTEAMQGMPSRTLTMGYDDIGRLLAEHDAVTGSPGKTTTYTYDDAGNRTYKGIDTDGNAIDDEYWVTDVSEDGLNHIESITDHSGAVVTFDYDLEGNRTHRAAGATTRTYDYDRENRLLSVTEGTSQWRYDYDYRTRRVMREENGQPERISFSGGTSVQEYTAESNFTPTVEYIRGSDLGGGIGGILYSVRGGTASFAHYNARGDVVAKSGSTGALTWQARYEGFGSRTAEIGTNPDKQRANTREEEVWGGLYENMRWRDLETGQYFTRDPAGFVDGPNLYAYVNQNPWTHFDPLGLEKFRKDVLEVLKRTNAALDFKGQSLVIQSPASREQKMAVLKFVGEENTTRKGGKAAVDFAQDLVGRIYSFGPSKLGNREMSQTPLVPEEWSRASAPAWKLLISKGDLLLNDFGPANIKLKTTLDVFGEDSNNASVSSVQGAVKQTLSIEGTASISRSLVEGAQEDLAPLVSARSERERVQLIVDYLRRGRENFWKSVKERRGLSNADIGAWKKDPQNFTDSTGARPDPLEVSNEYDDEQFDQIEEVIHPTKN